MSYCINICLAQGHDDSLLYFLLIGFCFTLMNYQINPALSISHCILVSFCHKSRILIWVDLFCPSLSQYQTHLITVALEVLISSSVSPPTLFFKIAMALLSIVLRFHRTF